MARTFTIKAASGAQELIRKARGVADQNGARLAGDERAGSFQGGGVSGTYAIDRDVVRVEITRKPFLVPWELVEGEIKKFFDA